MAINNVLLNVPVVALLVVVSLHVDAKHFKYNGVVSGRMTRNNLHVSPTLHRGAGKNLLLVKLNGVVLGRMPRFILIYC